MKLLHSSAGALALAAFTLSSCASVTGGALIRKGEQPATLVIRNTSGVGIDVVTLSRCSALSYGLNRLGGSQPEIRDPVAREKLRQEVLRAWEEYQRTGQAVPHDEVEAWMERLINGEDAEPPQCRD